MNKRPRGKSRDLGVNPISSLIEFCKDVSGNPYSAIYICSVNINTSLLNEDERLYCSYFPYFSSKYSRFLSGVILNWCPPYLVILPSLSLSV